jgi:protein phosphatase PTC1
LKKVIHRCHQTPYLLFLAILKLAGSKRRSLSGNGGLLNRMFGASSANPKPDDARTDNDTAPNTTVSPEPISIPQRKDDVADGNLTSLTDKKASPDELTTPIADKKRRNNSVSKAKDLFTNARQSFHIHGSSPAAEKAGKTPMQQLSKEDPALGVPQGPLNNSAGESLPGPHSTFRVGVTEDKNKKCRRTMEDTHAYLYNFLSTPPAAPGVETDPQQQLSTSDADAAKLRVETDNGYFAIFDGHAGTFAADWCGKKLHHVLEEIIRKNPNKPIPEVLDQTFTSVDQQLEKLPVKNSGCTAVTALLRWEDRVPNPASATGSSYINQAAAKAAQGTPSNGSEPQPNADASASSAADAQKIQASEARLRESATRQRVLYTANVGDARIVLCRSGRALRLSYDHKGSDESEGRRVANAGGLILNNRVNGVLAVTRALGDAYMKDLVTGHPYTTETVIQPDEDEFLILACDGVSDLHVI